MGTQIGADGLRYPTGTGPTNVEAQRARSAPVRLGDVPDDGDVPVWDETAGEWVPGPRDASDGLTLEDTDARYAQADDVRHIVVVSQAEYDGLTPDADTLYAIVG